MKKKYMIFLLIIIILLALTIFLVKNIDLTNTSHNTQYTSEVANTIISDNENINVIDNPHNTQDTSEVTNTIISADENINVDELIDKLIHSEEYSKMSDDEKIKACESLLKELKEKKAIKNYFYSSTDMIFSFEYSDGSLGGIMLKNWDPDFN